MRLLWADAQRLSVLAVRRGSIQFAEATGSGQLPHEEQPVQLVDAPAPVRWAEAAQIRRQASRFGRGQSPGHQRPVRPRRGRRAVREPRLRRRQHRRVGEPARSCLGGRRDDRPPATTRGSSPRHAPDGSARSTSHGASPRLSPDLSRPAPPVGWSGGVTIGAVGNDDDGPRVPGETGTSAAPAARAHVNVSPAGWGARPGRSRSSEQPRLMPSLTGAGGGRLPHG